MKKKTDQNKNITKQIQTEEKEKKNENVRIE